MLPRFLSDRAGESSSFDWRNTEQNIRVSEDDPYAAFQSDAAVYHDVPGDYVTNEPTLDVSALGIALISWYGAPMRSAPIVPPVKTGGN